MAKTMSAENFIRSTSPPTTSAIGDGGEGHLEGDEDEFRDDDTIGEGGDGAVRRHAGEEEFAGRDELVGVPTEGQRP
jgi:hypothetical protein